MMVFQETYVCRMKLKGRHGGVEKRGGRKASRMTPLPKRGFGPPLVRYVFHSPQVSTTEQNKKLFWRGPNIFGRARSLVRFPPPIRFAPPHITAQETPVKLGLCSRRLCGEKWRAKQSGHFELHVLRQEGQPNFTENFTAFSTATSTQRFKRMFTEACLQALQR